MTTNKIKNYTKEIEGGKTYCQIATMDSSGNVKVWVPGDLIQ